MSEAHRAINIRQRSHDTAVAAIIEDKEYAGIFFLDFGGSRWTSNIAIDYYRTYWVSRYRYCAMVLLVGIGKTFLDDYYLQMSSGSNLREMGVMLVDSMVLLTLVNKIPPMLAGIVGGGDDFCGCDEHNLG